MTSHVSKEGPNVDVGAELEYLRRISQAAGIDAGELRVPASKHVVANGMRLHYLDWGGTATQTALFLHGGGLQAHTWDLVCLSLKDDYRCIALDLRGHGDTEWSPVGDYRLEPHAADVEAFVSAMGYERFVLVGMSLGGLTSIVYAGKHSNLIEALVIVDVGPDVQTPGAQKIQAFMQAPAEFDSIDEIIDRAMGFNPRRDPEILRHSLLYNLRKLPGGKLTWKYDRRRSPTTFAEARSAERHALRAVVPKITCPTLVVRGAESDVFSDEDAEKFSRELPDGRWVKVAKAGHTVQGDNAKDLVSAIEAFVQEVRG
jgi:pimeloyl-ACP methyl ester carboxylesterase